MTRTVAATLAVASLCLSGVCAPGAAAAEPAAGAARTYLGRAVHVGAGTARILVEADAARRPVAFGIEFTADALKSPPGQPDARDHSLDWHYYLWFPKKAPATGFDHVLIDWHPHGHPPKGIYTVPHFDFHFYLISLKKQRAIHYVHEESPNMAGVVLPPKDLIPPGYFIPPGTQVDRMGVHAVAKAAPEFHGDPFTYTLIFGYDNKTLAFLEPMVATAFLATRPEVSAGVAAPESVSFTAYYPGRYSVSYDAKRQVYRVIFDRLQLRHTAKLASAAATR
jgi:hypothetical protein